jgi:hypothetical protein
VCGGPENKKENKLKEYGSSTVADTAPEWIPDDKQRNVLFVRITQDLIAFSFDHIAVGQYQRLLIKRLLPSTLSDPVDAQRGQVHTNRDFSTIKMLVYASR